jgi:hypothetical protein
VSILLAGFLLLIIIHIHIVWGGMCFAKGQLCATMHMVALLVAWLVLVVLVAGDDVV